MMDGSTPFSPDQIEGADDDTSVDDTVGNCPALDLEIMMFFDGTGNNLLNVSEGNQRRADGLEPSPIGSYNNDMSNVAKLYLQSQEIAEEVRNNCGGVAKLRRFEIMDGIGTTAGQKDSTAGFALGWGVSGVVARVEDGWLRFLRHINEAKRRGEIKEIKVDVFGFSRGAAAARHFVNCVHRGNAGHGFGGPTYELQDEEYAKLEVRFVGLFDTVVSWGLVANDRNHGILRIGLRDDSASKIVHITALDEFRENFPLTEAPSGAETIRMPGAHSDIGGGYADFWVERTEIVAPERAFSNSVRRPTTPEEIAAFLRPTPADEALRLQLVADGWLRPDDVNAIEREYLPIGTYSYDPYYVRRYMNRPWLNHRLSHVALHVMHDRALAAGVPFPASLPVNDDYAVPAGLTPLLGQLIGGAKLTSADSRPYRRDYVHHSAHWTPQFIFTPMMPAGNNDRTEYPNPAGEAIAPH